MPAWDQLLVYLIVALAALYLARQAFGKRRGGCATGGGCSGCPSSQASPPPDVKSELVQLELTPRSNGRTPAP